MAYVANSQDEDEQQKQTAGPVSPTAGGVHLAPSSGVGTAGTPGSGTPGAAPKNAGGQFATLDKYITANQSQAQPLANKITGGINDQYNTLNQGNASTLQSINGQVASAPGYTKGDSGLLSQEAANPTSFANDTNNIASFQKQLTNSYGGPASAEGTNEYQAQQAKLNSAISQGNAQTQTEAGRKQLIANNSAKPTAGVTALNSAILSENPNYLGQVQDAYKPFQNLVTGLGAGAADTNKTIAAETADAANSSKAAKDQISGQISGLNTAVQNNLTATQKTASDQNAAVKNALTTGTADDNVLKTLGISKDQWNGLTAAQKAAATSQAVQSNQGQFGANTATQNIDLNQWLTQQDPNAVFNAGNTATADQYAQAGAFQNLLKGLNLGTPQSVLDPSQAAQAGTAPTNLNKYDFQTAAGTTTATAGAERASAQAYVDALQQGADEEHAQLAAQQATHNANTIAAATNVIGIPTAALSALGVGGDVGKYADKFTQAIGAPIRKVETQAGNAVGNVVNGRGNTGTNLLEQGAINTVGLGIPQAVHAITNIFCFHPWTLIDMADGSTKAIFEVQIGDETRGGKVLATTRGVGTQFYMYESVLVTAKHAVREDGRWVRVEDSVKGRKFPHLTEVVCNLVTEKHRIWAHGVEFADEHETDQYENLNLNESLEALNRE